VAEDMTLLIFAIHSGTCAVEMLPRATCQSSFHHCCALSMELPLVFDQHGRELSRTHRHAYRLQEVQDFWLTHPICIIESQDPCSDSGSKLTGVARWKSRQIRPFVAGRGVFFFTEPDVLGTKRNVLHDDVLIALKLSISRHGFFINLHHLNPIDPDLSMLGGFVVRFGDTTF